MSTLFFDIGSTLVDEGRAYDHWAEMITDGTGITFDAFDEKRREFYRLGMDGNSKARDFFRLEDKPWPNEDETVYDDAKSTLGYLKKRGYKLGIIANQPAGTEKRLLQYGLLDYFSVVVPSFESGFKKPDSRIFLKALGEAGETAQNAWMIGDRIDNDIIPARNLGMKTVWMKSGMWRLTAPEYSLHIADLCINKLSDLRDYF